MASEDECMREMYVEIEWQKRTFGVPLAQLQPLEVDEDTQEAIADWHYWVARLRILSSIDRLTKSPFSPGGPPKHIQVGHEYTL